MDTFLRSYAETRAFSLGQPVHCRLVDAEQRVLFLRGEARSASLALYELDLATQRERLLLRAQDLIGGEETLSEEEKARRERTRSTLRGLVSFSLSPDEGTLILPLGGRVFTYDRATGQHAALPIENALDAQLTPDGRRVVFVRDGDLHVLDVTTREVRQLTAGATETRSFGLAEFVAQEEMGRMFGYVCSPDGEHIVYQETETAGVEVLCISDPMRPEKEPARLRYPRAGRANAEVRLWLRRLDGGGVVTELTWDKRAFPYLATFAWGAQLGFLVQDRTQRHEQLHVWREGKSEVVREEKDGTWVNLFRGVPKWTRHGLLWISERSGHATLTLDDTPLLPHIVELVGADDTHCYALATTDPTHLELHRVDLATKRAERIPLANAERSVHVRKTRFIETASSRTEMRRTVVRDYLGQEIAELKSVAEQPPFLPNVTWQTVAAAGHTFHAAIVRPREARGKLPVLLSVYGGPHHLHVSGQREPYFREQWLAEQGYIVVAIDNRGTPRRGREWERAIALDLATVPVADQCDALLALCTEHADFDRARMGVFGWSYGGYMSALTLMLRPDVFKSGVAGAPVVDWRDYDTHYTERYLQLPSDNAAGYAQSSLLTHAPQLKRPLLLIHGTADDNVYFFHSLKLSDALTRHGIAHNVLPLAGATHMVAEPALVERLWQAIANHFKQTV